MGNFLKIFGSIIALTLIYLWMSSMFQSCGNKAKETPDDAIDIVDDIGAEGEELVEVIDEELFEDDNKETEIVEEDYNSFETIEDEEDEAPSSVSNTSTSNNTSYSNSNGQYLVISGNYLVESNANTMKKKLNNMGYNSAEIVVFDNSQYRTVIASRHNSYNDALSISSELKRKGIDCYVKKKN